MTLRVRKRRVAAVDVTAARGTDGLLTIGLINVDPGQAAEVELSLPGKAGGAVSGQVLTAPKMDSRNPLGVPATVKPAPFTGARWQGGKLRVAMPAKSLVVLSLK